MLTRVLQVHISTTTDPRAAWELLQKQFEFASITQIVRLNRKFYAATMKEGTDIMEHITYMTSLAEQLRELKEDISDRKFATVMLGSLPESYDNFISSLNAREVEDLNWENVKGLLVEEFVKRKEKNDKQTESTGRNEALFSNRGHFPGRRNAGRGNFSGKGNFSCRGRYQRNTTGQGGDQGQNHLKCYKCEQYGHIVKNCPLNKKNGKSNIAEHKEENQGCEMALNSMTSERNEKDYWFIDSGATKHMTSHKELIIDYVVYKAPSKIYLGDNRVIEAYGEGKVRLQCLNDESEVVTLAL